MKIVINGDVGAFRLSRDAIRLYRAKRGGPMAVHQSCKEMSCMFARELALRADPVLVEVVEQLGARANGEGAQLEIAEVPDDTPWTLVNVCGIEAIIAGTPHCEGER